MTSAVLTSIRKLRRIAAALDAGNADTRWLANCLQNYFDGASRGLTLELAFGLSSAAGHANWWTKEAVQARDTALREGNVEHRSLGDCH